MKPGLPGAHCNAPLNGGNARRPANFIETSPQPRAPLPARGYAVLPPAWTKGSAPPLSGVAKNEIG